MQTKNPFDPKAQADQVGQIIVDLALTLEPFRTAEPEIRQCVIESLRDYSKIFRHIQYTIDTLEGKSESLFRDCCRCPGIPEPKPEVPNQPPAQAQADTVANLVRELTLKVEVVMDCGPEDRKLFISRLWPYGDAFAYCVSMISAFEQAAKGPGTADFFLLKLCAPPRIPKRSHVTRS